MLGSDTPVKVKNAKLGKWYDTLQGPDRVKLNRYLDFADDSDAASFISTVIMAAIDDSNYRFAAKVADTAPESGFTPIQAFDVNEAEILALWKMERYDECIAKCNRGLELLTTDRDVESHVRSRTEDGSYPETIYCRNYLINAVVGVKGDYDGADRILDNYVRLGLISAEEAGYRKNSIQTYRLQKTFDGVFSGRKAL